MTSRFTLTAFALATTLLLGACTKPAVIDRIVKLVIAHNITVEQLVDALGGLSRKRRLGPVAQKYRDPETGRTWSGRGKEPLWLRGQDRSKFQIP